MGYVPFRPKRSDESEAEYVAYLVAFGQRQARLRLLTIPFGLAIAAVIVVLSAVAP